MSAPWPKPYVTFSLIGASVAVALLTNLGDNREMVSWFIVGGLEDFDGTISGGLRDLRHGQLWRVLTPIFVHFSFPHILFNMMGLKQLGTIVEMRWSPRALVVLVLISGVLSNFLQYLVNWDLKNGLEYANVLSGGMSGVIYALFGYVWIRLRNEHATDRLPKEMIVVGLIWLVLCMTGVLGHIGNMAHLSGLVIGAALGKVAARKPQDDKIIRGNFPG